MKGFSLLLTGAFLSVVFSVGQVGSEEAQPQIVMRDIIVADHEFTLFQLEKRFRGLLRQEGAVPRVLKVEAFTDPKTVSGTFKYTSDVSYEAWLAWYLDYAKAIPSSAELLVINGNAAMRVRDASGAIQTLVLEGSNPYALNAGGIDFYLLHLAASKSAPITSKKWDERTYVSTLSLFLVTQGNVNQKVAEAVSEKLRAMTGVEQATVEIRSDAWFIRDEAFPIVSPYVKLGTPPTKEEYEHSRQWSCIANSEGVQCSISGAGVN